MTNFLFDIGDRVKLVESSESGEIVGRAEYANSINNYLIRYCAGDGRQVEVWWTEDAIEVVE